MTRAFFRNAAICNNKLYNFLRLRAESSIINFGSWRRTFMIALTIIGLMLGAVLGLRFKVLILVPVTLFGIVGIALIGLAAGLNVSWMAVTLATLGLDLGYLGMTAIRFVIVPALRLRSVPAPTTLSKSAY